MQIFFKTLTGRTLAQEVEPTTFINEAKAQIAAAEGIPADQQIMIAAGEELDDSCTFADYNIEDEAIVNFVVDMCGGGKKRKKKNYTTPKKIKHKHKKVKLAVLKYYKVDDNGKITRLRRECPNSTCGAGVFMAWHTDRQYCGRCGLTYLLNKEESA